MSLVEVGPRCCFNPIKMFAGSFGGPVLYDNPAYVSPNRVCPHSQFSICDVELWLDLLPVRLLDLC